ncbi:hypothetical protein Poli38472_008193 [Pythium oligandrum]|uniref:HOOK N-terminal domain-containing protein n=1 Tax=Pythium oligandrum TaxID=41045 RepID=A0A8K1FK20_PYTOL|nr:hypothetical protein Poli38472_008193 [Pythium oligandrum]|eukprot:TMW65551.1 hypothetical protein Poli38472_008193 [Pythium oligandrum]
MVSASPGARADGDLMATTEIAEAASIAAWLRFYVEKDGHQQTQRIALTVLELLRVAFPVIYEDVLAANAGALDGREWSIIVMLLEAFYETSLGIDKALLVEISTMEDASQHPELVKLLEFVLGAVVQSDEKARFVRDIMIMDDAVQVDIMAVIERVLSHAANPTAAAAMSEPVSSEASDVTTQQRGPSSPATSTNGRVDSPSSARSPLHLSRNAEFDRLKRENGVLKDENAHFSKELEQLESKYQHANAENATLVSSIQELKLQSEIDLLKKERTIRNYFDDRIQTLQQDLDTALSQLEEKTTVAKEVSELRDEIDLLRPAADKLAKAEAMLAKYKTKIEELTSAKEKLRRTEEANSELVEKNLALESQVAKAASLQRKLADAKDANTTIQFRVSELEAQLSRQGAELDAKRQECEVSAAALHEAAVLNQQLQETVDHQLQGSGGSYGPASVGVGDGMSELNPELMQKLARLEHENATLKSQIDGSTSDRIDSLLDEIDDLTRLKKSFESKYFETSDLLKSTQAELKNEQVRVSDWEATYTKQSEELAEMTQDRNATLDLLQQAKIAISELESIKLSLERNVADLQARQKELEDDRQRRLAHIASATEDLRRTTETLYMTNERKSCLEEDVLAHEMARAEELHVRQQLSATINALELHNQSLEDQIDTMNGNIARLEERVDEMVVAAQEKQEEYEVLSDSLKRTQEDLSVSQSTCTDLEESLSNLRDEKEVVSFNLEAAKKELQVLADEKSETIAHMTGLARTTKERFESHEAKLRETVKLQLDANRRLMEVNQAVKEKLMHKEAQNTQLENAVTRLESRVMLLEREKTHYSTEEGRKWETAKDVGSFSPELNSHLTQIMAELDKLRKEHMDLEHRHYKCRSDSQTGGGSDVSKNYYLDRVRQLQLAKAQEEDKKRELLLVNAKLIQDQKQYQVKHALAVQEVQQLKEKTHTWMLRDERRRKEVEQLKERIQQLEQDKERMQTSNIVKDVSSASGPPLDPASTESPLAPEESNDTAEATLPETPQRPAQDDEQENIPPFNDSSAQQTSDRKRKLDIDEDPTEQVDTLTLDSVIKPLAVDPSIQRRDHNRGKRRLSHFITNRPAMSEEAEKPSECQQQ